MAKDGTLLLVQIGGVTLTGLIDNSMGFDIDMIEVTTKDSSGHKAFMAGEDGWTIDFSNLYDPTGTYGFKQALVAAKAKVSLTVIFGEVVSTSKDYWTGSALFNSLSLTAPKGGEAGFSGTLQGTGDLTASTTAAS